MAVKLLNYAKVSLQEKESGHLRSFLLAGLLCEKIFSVIRLNGSINEQAPNVPLLRNARGLIADPLLT